MDENSGRKGTLTTARSSGRHDDKISITRLVLEAWAHNSRAACLKAHWLLTLADAREKMETWRRYYNEDWPHGAIGNVPPAALINANGATGPLLAEDRKL